MIFSIRTIRNIMRWLNRRLDKLVVKRSKDIEKANKELERVYGKVADAWDDILFAEELIKKVK